MAKMQLDAAEAHPRAREILSALDPTVPIAVRTAGPGEWITAEHMCSIMQAAYEVGGEELAQEVAKSVATRTKDHPFFKPLVHATMRLLGGGPAPYFKFLRRAWGLVMKDAGTFSIDIYDSDCRIELAELPDVMDKIGFKHSWVGTVRGILEIAEHDAYIELHIGKTGFALDVDWSDPSESSD